MATESDETRQKSENSKLTDRQVKFLPVLLASPTQTQACQAGHVSRQTLHEWFRQPAFKAEFDRQRDELVAQGFARLCQNVSKAVETLVGLLDAKDGHLKRLAAVNILSLHTKFKELDDLTHRVEAIEEKLDGPGRT
jgi:hypothetical protein